MDQGKGVKVSPVDGRDLNSWCDVMNSDDWRSRGGSDVV